MLLILNLISIQNSIQFYHFFCYLIKYLLLLSLLLMRDHQQTCCHATARFHIYHVANDLQCCAIEHQKMECLYVGNICHSACSKISAILEFPCSRSNRCFI